MRDGLILREDAIAEKYEDNSASFNGMLKESKEFISIMDYGLSLLSGENLELKKQILSQVIRKTRTLEKLMELGTKHAVQSSLYDLEQMGFITRKIRTENELNIFYYVFTKLNIIPTN